MSGNARLRTAVDKRKAMKQYETLRRANVVEMAVVIARLKDGSYHVLGQELTPYEMAPLLVVAAEALAAAEADRKIVKLVAHVEPEKRGIHNRSKPRAKQIRTAPDGTLIPPPGQHFISCGECDHPQWFVLLRDDDDRVSGHACSHCGNEIHVIQITHPGGTA